MQDPSNNPARAPNPKTTTPEDSIPRNSAELDSENDGLLLRVAGVSKRFPGVQALRQVKLEVRPGEVLALVGENGAGKSTLMKILGGIVHPDEGRIWWRGQPARITSVHAARALGIALIHQELLLAPNLDVAGNLFLGGENQRWGMLDRAEMNRRAWPLLERVGLQVSPTTPLRRLTTGQMQMVEIAKALALNAQLLIMDEPTSSLSSAESERLFAIVDELKRGGIAVIYISHRMEEIRRLSDRVSVLRDGQWVGDLDARASSHEQIASMMVGREFRGWFPTRQGKPGAERLQVRDLHVPGTRHRVSFSARVGEIVGFAGLVGAGRTELMRVLFGLDPPLGGSMVLDGISYRPQSPRAAIKAGVYLAPEDRKRHGLVLPFSVANNMSLPAIAHYRPRWWLARGRENKVATEQIQKLSIKTPSPHQAAMNLSGGNQQKIVLGKWLAMNPRVLILDEPTRGIDVGAKAEIYRHVVELADQGVTVLLVSSEMEEVIGLSDRVIVLHERRIAGSLSRGEATEQRVISLMTGATTAGDAVTGRAEFH